MTKKIINFRFSLLGTVFMLLSMTNGHAQIIIDDTAGYCGSVGDSTHLAWVLTSDSVLTISGSGAMADYTSFYDYNYYHSTALWAYGDRVTTVIIEAGVTSIGNYAFYGCNRLRSVTIGDNVTKIGNFAFFECAGITSLTIGNSVTDIGLAAFSECTRLSSVTIPNSVVRIGNSAFQNSGNLTSITLGNSVESIGDLAFFDCRGLGVINLPNSLKTIGDAAFGACTFTTITIPSGVTQIGNYVFRGCANLTAINVDANNHRYSSIDGILYSKIQDTLISCPEKKGGDITVPNTVAVMVNNAFFNCGNILTMNIPHSVVSIGDNVFSYCNSLTAINVDGNNPRYSSANGLLYSKTQDTLIRCPVWKQEIIVTGTIVLPNTITTIKNAAFLDCKTLRVLTIPKNVTSIENEALYLCNSLTAIIVRAKIPPTLGNDVFYTVPAHISIYVPCDTKSAYQSASKWNYFSNFQDTIAIQHPDTVEVERENNSLIISWASTGATSYEVYRNDALLTTVSTTTYTDNSMTSNTNYCYQIKAVDGNCKSNLTGKVFCFIITQTKSLLQG